MDALFLLGRILFAALFILSGVNHLTKVAALSQYAASKKVPAPRAAVVLSGLVILAGGLSILLGYAPRIGALLLVLFLVPTSFAMHNFWTVADPMQRQVEVAMFLKNLALTGGALMTYYFTAAHPETWVSSLGR
jgi:putative oxidoreductase